MEKSNTLGEIKSFTRSFGHRYGDKNDKVVSFEVNLSDSKVNTKGEIKNNKVKVNVASNLETYEYLVKNELGESLYKKLLFSRSYSKLKKIYEEECSSSDLFRVSTTFNLDKIAKENGKVFTADDIDSLKDWLQNALCSLNEEFVVREFLKCLSVKVKG